MDSLYIHNSRTLILLILLFLIFGKILSLELSNLSTTCVYSFETNTLTPIKPPRGVCTAVASIKTPYDFRYPTLKSIMINFKKDLPYVYIYNEYTLTKFKTQASTNIDILITRMIRKIRNVDVLVFDFDHQMEHATPDKDRNLDNTLFQANFKFILNKIKESKEDMLIGLKIDNNANAIQSVFNPSTLEKSVDFYVATFNPVCIYNTYPQKPKTVLYRKHMEKTINEFQQIGIEKNKLFLSIPLYALVMTIYFNGIKLVWNPKSEIPSSKICKDSSGLLRNYCIESLENFYQKGKLSYDQHLAGVFIQPLDYDDYENHCQCGKFPAVYAIINGAKGLVKNTELTGCQILEN